MAANPNIGAGYTRHLPNLLTAIRLVLVPFVIWAILNRRHTLAVTVFVVAAFTDIGRGGRSPIRSDLPNRGVPGPDRG